MTEKISAKLAALPRRQAIIAAALCCAIAAGAAAYASAALASANRAVEAAVAIAVPEHVPLPTVHEGTYDGKLRALAHLPEPVTPPTAEAPAETVSSEKPAWPVLGHPYPNAGAILPSHRILAYYGNFYAKGMGVLGEYPEEQMLAMWEAEVAKWEKADPTTPVMRAVDYIAIVAQGSAGKDGLWRTRMPGTEIEKAIALAEKINGIVILEVQPGLSALMTEVRSLEPYLKHPKVHLAIDPEFAMKKSGRPPGTVVGTVDAAEVNEAIQFLSGLARQHDLPPKVLVVHRYTRAMVTNATKIAPTAEVQVVMDMDGWGSKPKKLSTYKSFIVSEPVQFTGFKLFYKNDFKGENARIMTPEEVLELLPQPSFIQFQ